MLLHFINTINENYVGIKLCKCQTYPTYFHILCFLHILISQPKIINFIIEIVVFLASLAFIS